MIWFRISPHKQRAEAEMVEVFDGNRLLATIEPLKSQLLGIHLESKLINKFSVAPPPASAGPDAAIDTFEIFFAEKR